MHDDAVLVAADAAFRAPSYCTCGKSLTMTTRDGALWLECPVLEQPSRLPAPIRALVRNVLHECRFVVALPEDEVGAPVAAPLAGAPRHLPSFG